ncbi:MAG: 30S ribosomal protein S8 [Erysipelotrichaceae bacterium]|jgi:small subunit ribosomal protein S8|nr:30S ribosomal protein S8 [Erysipelotrichaceae bacterium]MCB9499763.1 30S ribosomal protein S8 [Erysipelotrichaceae bacterium]
MHQDPIADMLTRIRNANALNHDKVSMPSSKMKVGIASILLSEGFINNFKEIKDKDGKKSLEIMLKYGPDGEKVISGLKRISKPGLRVTADSKHLPYVLRGLGIAIISTSKGLLTDKGCRLANIGGEVICYIW